MSIASSLSTILHDLQNVLESINSALAEKGIVTEADTLGEVPGKIGDIETGGGTPVLEKKSSYVTATIVSTSKITFSGLDVSEGEKLVGLEILSDGTPTSSPSVVGCLLIVEDGDDWNIYRPSIGNNIIDFTIPSDAAMSFTKTSETGGEIVSNLYTFSNPSYIVRPIVATVS